MVSTVVLQWPPTNFTARMREMKDAKQRVEQDHVGSEGRILSRQMRHERAPEREERGRNDGGDERRSRNRSRKMAVGERGGARVAVAEVILGILQVRVRIFVGFEMDFISWPVSVSSAPYSCEQTRHC
ncbi:hypothetical protein HAX54_017012 [Datura stramonium]|uniref:Uncharacterized protein n=1 Tax=Datura stramonium TaxID=4076 RepID=A0ABS8S100_DATST|nr:hypothetical protein [Datura stramonium]